MAPSSLSHRPQVAAQLLRNLSEVWSGRDLAPIKALSTGHDCLDAILPGGGWPLGALTELIPLHEGIGELALPMPSLKRLCDEKRRVVFIRPPYIPYAPALLRAGLPLHLILWIDAPTDADARWAAEQILRGGTAGAVLLWSDANADRPLRRLQLAAEEGESLAFVYRPAATSLHPSPAALRIVLRASRTGLSVEVIKARGGRCGNVILPSLMYGT
jgi:cell division inhibitor SulA/protein ImuA